MSDNHIGGITAKNVRSSIDNRLLVCQDTDVRFILHPYTGISICHQNRGSSLHDKKHHHHQQKTWIEHLKTYDEGGR